MKTLLYRPVITEKSLTKASKGWYTFAVHVDADKKQVAASIATQYGVKVLEVRTMIMHGKVRRIGKKMQSFKRSDWKKALIHIEAGQKIDAFEVMSEQQK